MEYTHPVCGNPKPKSRTLEAGVFVAERLTGQPPDVVLDLVDIVYEPVWTPERMSEEARWELGMV